MYHFHNEAAPSRRRRHLRRSQLHRTNSRLALAAGACRTRDSFMPTYRHRLGFCRRFDGEYSVPGGWLRADAAG